MSYEGGHVFCDISWGGDFLLVVGGSCFKGTTDDLISIFKAIGQIVILLVSTEGVRYGQFVDRVEGLVNFPTCVDGSSIL